MVRPAQAPPDKFGVVLVLLCVGYLVYALTAAPWAHWVVPAVYLAALSFAVRTSRPGPRVRRLVRVLLAVSAVVVAGALALLPRDAAIGVLDAVLIVLLGTTLAIILGRVLSGRDVTLSAIAGALSAYLVIGLLFANVFGVLAWVMPEPFFAGGQEADQQSLQYFSFTTLTTVGYGDYTAASYPGRGVATFEALVAQVFLATLVARLVASFRRPGAPPEQGPGVAPGPATAPGPPGTSA
ncbi:Ion transport 2 domain protein [Cellulomonas fimi ATCC 484]|uniref:Ion transport 2 domain protein n=1 Tax=Cellulomonas fimi (strain ATCC 484 / DSM 20113 / JCM 1341 / CCUG 24087 / LMG 16345 / NBRC 15513 / NCIMB 8980 / NCTC 7547 / NRS-133) TaxID=590998 RepID=F4H0Y5_CELFA|nr:Ion transport 2 domain protein [Cellulomonas fimi ATCC 484]VEH32162.1 Ion channel [Cellulomonas fimi]